MLRASRHRLRGAKLWFIERAMSQLKGKRALVCGGSKGIGLEVVKALADLGCEVIALARDEDALKSAVQALPSSAKHSYWVQDLGDLVMLESNLKSRVKEMGEIHILVNNTGGPKGGPLLNATGEEIVTAFRTHLLAAHLLTQSLVPGMRQAGYGRIINILSTSVKIPLPNLGVSNTIRGAMASWSKTLSLELAPFGITVNNVLPGYTKTDRLAALQKATAEREKIEQTQVEKRWLDSIPAARFGNPAETAQAVAFLASPNASYINGVNLPVDGGRTGSL